MHLKSWFVISLAVVSSSLATAQLPGPAPKPEEIVVAKTVMNNVYDSFVKIIPYVYADKNAADLFKETANQKELIKNLTEISHAFQGAKHVEFFQKPGFRPSLETINTHLDETINSIKSQNFVFAQSRLKAVTALCVSCHSALPESISQNAFGDALNKEKRGKFESDFAYANYLYLVRRFSEADFYFELTIKSALEKADAHMMPEHELSASLRRILSIYTKITFNPDKAEAVLKKYVDHKNMPKALKGTMEDWLKNLGEWKKFDPRKVKSVTSFVDKYLVPLEAKRDLLATGQKDVTLLISAGVLSKYLTDHPRGKMTPEILYWLSIAERRLSTSYFFSLSDLYLKDCITLYPKSAWAKKCYQEYEDNITFGFSGSKGTDIPSEEKKELERLKKVLK